MTPLMARFLLNGSKPVRCDIPDAPPYDATGCDLVSPLWVVAGLAIGLASFAGLLWMGGGM
jgi:hypothetical protein